MKVEKFLVISSMGANPKSPVFYSRMKGLLEQELKIISIKSLHIFRPSLLIGDRKEFRIGESISAYLTKEISFIFVGPMKKYKPIDAKTVAKGMYMAAQSRSEGIFTYLSNDIEYQTRGQGFVCWKEQTNPCPLVWLLFFISIYKVTLNSFFYGKLLLNKKC